MKPKIALGIPPINNFKGVVELLDSVKTEHPYEVIIIDQWRHTSRPLAEAWNLIIQRAMDRNCDYIFILNDDILFGPDSVDNAIKEFENQDDNVILLSLNNIFGQLTDPYQIINKNHPYIPGDIADHPNFSCFVVKKDFFERHGKFDENFKPAWFEDNDSHYRAHLLGYREVCTTAAECVHFGGVSTALLPEANRSSEHSRSYFIKKWGSMTRLLSENFKTPYNDPNLTPKDWKPNYE